MREHVLYMSGLDELEAAALDEWDVAALKFELEVEGVEAGAEQHRDFAQLDALLAQLQDALGDEARLHVFVLGAHQQRAELAAALGGEHLGVLIGGARDDLVGDIEDAL